MEDDSDTLERSAYAASRMSPQRAVIATAVNGMTRAFSIEDLIGEVRLELPGIGAATVYRAVSAMEATGFVESLGMREGSAIYARCRSEGHHHHLVCTVCGAVTDTRCPITLHAHPAPAGFRVTGHTLVLYGQCAACRREASAEGPALEAEGA